VAAPGELLEDCLTALWRAVAWSFTPDTWWRASSIFGLARICKARALMITGSP
jgi:hypothetical protein